MGAWGTGIFDNDSAADWANACASASGLSLIERAFAALLDGADPDDPDAVPFVDADDANQAAAAADALARLLGVDRPTNAYCESLATWAKARRGSLAVPTDLAHRAIEALDSVVSEGSELAEMWAEDGRESARYKAFHESITELKQQLVDISGLPTGGAFRLDALVRRATEGERLEVPEGTHRWTVAPKVALTIVGRSAQATRIALPQRLLLEASLSLQDLAIDAESLAFEVAGSSLSLERVTVASGGSSVFVHGGGEASLRDSELSSNDGSGDNLPGVEAVGERSRVSIQGGSVRGKTGVYVHDQAFVRLRNARVVGDKAPAVRVHASSVLIEHCHLTGGESGVYVRERGRAVLRACTLSRSKLPQIEVHDASVRVVGGTILDGEDDGIDVHPGAMVEVESVRFRNNDIALRVMGGRATLLDVSVEDCRSAGVVAQDDGEVDIRGGAIHTGDAAALEAFDRGVIRARGTVCENADGEPRLAYDDGLIEYEALGGEPSVRLDDVACWRLIAEAREAARAGRGKGDLESAVAAQLIDVLSKTDVATITRFDHFLRKRMAEAYRWDLWGVAYVMNGGCSDDGFDYFLGWLIGQGRERYSAALLYPELAAAGCSPEEEPFSNEDMLGVGQQAYRRLTGSNDAEDFFEVYVERVPRKVAGTPFDEDEIMTKYPSLARFTPA